MIIESIMDDIFYLGARKRKWPHVARPIWAKRVRSREYIYIYILNIYSNYNKYIYIKRGALKEACRPAIQSSWKKMPTPQALFLFKLGLIPIVTRDLHGIMVHVLIAWFCDNWGKSESTLEGKESCASFSYGKLDPYNL